MRPAEIHSVLHSQRHCRCRPCHGYFSLSSDDLETGPPFRFSIKTRLPGGSDDLNPPAFLQAPRLDRHSVHAKNLKTGVINFTKPLFGVFCFKNILSTSKT